MSKGFERRRGDGIIKLRNGWALVRMMTSSEYSPLFWGNTASTVTHVRSRAFSLQLQTLAKTSNSIFHRKISSPFFFFLHFHSSFHFHRLGNSLRFYWEKHLFCCCHCWIFVMAFVMGFSRYCIHWISQELLSRKKWLWFVFFSELKNLSIVETSFGISCRE